jgi:hypothetical protein
MNQSRQENHKMGMNQNGKENHSYRMSEFSSVLLKTGIFYQRSHYEKVSIYHFHHIAIDQL